MSKRQGRRGFYTYDIKDVLRACKKELGIKVVKLLGCGSFGCVFLTSNPLEVLKITTQSNEYNFAKFLLEHENKVNHKFPKIHKIWDLTSCYSKFETYAILRENIKDIKESINRSWFDDATADLESESELYFEKNGEISKKEIIAIASEILEQRPGTVIEETQFMKLVEFYGWAMEQGILITDALWENFGQRDDGELVLRDLGGVHLLKKNPSWREFNVPHREKFQWGRYIWDVTRANELIKLRKKNKSPHLVDVDEIYNNSSRINTDYALKKSDFTKPLIFGLIEIDKEWLRILIDGHHRLYRAKHESIKTLPAYSLTKAENKKVITIR